MCINQIKLTQKMFEKYTDEQIENTYNMINEFYNHITNETEYDAIETIQHIQNVKENNQEIKQKTYRGKLRKEN